MSTNSRCFSPGARQVTFAGERYFGPVFEGADVIRADPVLFEHLVIVRRERQYAYVSDIRGGGESARPSRTPASPASTVERRETVSWLLSFMRVGLMAMLIHDTK